jgi:dTDP-4-amino-4,6-dideoxygalactose transaminase
VPYEPEWSKGVYHLYVTQVADRDGVIQQLAEAKIGTGIHYPVPLHLQKAYEYLGYKDGDFPVSEMLAPKILSLPMFPGLQPQQQRHIVGAIAEFRSMAFTHNASAACAGRI